MHANNDNNAIKFDKLIKKYNLFFPFPKRMKKRIKKSRRKNYMDILKKTGHYTLVIGLASYIIFALKKVGITISVMYSATILFVTSLLLITSISVGIYFVAGYMESKKIVVPIKEKIVEELTKNEEKIDIVKQAKTEKVQKILQPIKFPIILIEKMQSANVDKKVANLVTGYLSKNLSKLRGSRSISSTVPKNDNYVVLKSSLEYSSNVYTLNVKIYDTKNFEYILFLTETSNSIQSLKVICSKVAGEINEKIKEK